MNGSDDPSNLIELTVEEHAEAHRKLYEQYGKWQDKIAWQMLSGQIGKEELIKQIQIEVNTGRYFSPETREKMAAKKRGKKISEEHKKALNLGRKNSKNSPEHLAILSKVHKGKKISDEQKMLMSENRKNHPRKNEISSLGGKVSMQKYKNDPKRQHEFSNTMKNWWANRKQKLQNELGGK